ncbi:MAG TPA: divergent PAP2 family protein [Candidatus Krumholzibacteria bacterium]
MIHRVAVAALAAGLSAQLLKIVVELIRTGRLDLLRFFDNGGMPSSHTALVTTLTVLVGHDAGVGSPLFAVTFLFSLYFIFEAAGLRQEVGNQGRLLNELVEEMRHTHHVDPARLKELVGHTWGEVFGGFVYGVLVALVVIH